MIRFIFSRFNVARLVGVIIWLYGCYNTYFALELFFQVNTGYHQAASIAAAILLQAAFTLLEWDIYNDRPNGLSFVALFFDVLFNATGLYRGVYRIPETEVGIMIRDTTPYNFGNWHWFVLPVSLVLGWFVAMSAERLLQTELHE